MNVKKLRESSGMNLTQFCQYFKIPYRTLQNWEHEERKCPEYLFELMEYKLRKEGLIKGECYGETHNTHSL